MFRFLLSFVKVFVQVLLALLLFYVVLESIPGLKFRSQVVVGTGCSGLATASVLAQEGRKVAVLEQHNNVGGSLQTFYLKGKSGLDYEFQFGMSVQSVPDTQAYKRVTGKDIIIEPFDENEIGYVYPNRTQNPWRIPNGFPSYMEYGSQIFPHFKDVIRNVRNFLRRVYQLQYPLEKLFSERYKISDESLKYFFTFLEPYLDMDVITTEKYMRLVFFNIWQKIGFPRGSAKNIVDGAVRMIENNNGGKVFTSCRATKLILNEVKNIKQQKESASENNEQESVEGVDSTCGTFTSKYVVSSMGAKNTFGGHEFIPKHILEKYGFDRKMEDLQDGNRTAVVHFIGFNATQEILGLPTTNIFYNNFEGMNDIDDPFTVKKVLGICLSCRDPEYPKDRSALIILNYGISYESHFKIWEDSKTGKRPNEYYEFKKGFEVSVLEWMEEMYPNAKSHLDVMVTSTPLTIRDILGHPKGALFHAMDSIKRGEKRSNRLFTSMKTEIDGFYVTGQDVHWLGVQLNLNQGIVLAESILEDMKEEK